MSKTAAKGAKSKIEELEDSLGDLGTPEAADLKNKVSAEIARGPQFDDADSAPAGGSYVGKRVRFDGEETGQIGTIVTHDEKTGDVVIRDEKQPPGMWDSTVGDLEILPEQKAIAEPIEEPIEVAPAGVPETEKPTSKEKPAKGGRKKSKDAPAAEAAGVAKTPNEIVYDVRAVKVSEVKIPKLYPRKLAPESAEYQRIKADFEAGNQQEEAIVLDSWDGKTLVEGLTRLSIFKELGRNMILARVKAGIESDEARLYQGVRLNDKRNKMHYLDYAHAFAHLVTSGYMKSGQIAKEFDINPSEVTRMIAAAQLPKNLQELARKTKEDDPDQLQYSKTIVLELAGAPEKARKQVTELMEKGATITTTDVREYASDARKQEDKTATENGQTPPARTRGGAVERPTKAATYADLTSKETGEFMHFRVFGNRVEVSFTIQHENKTFRNFELLKAIKLVVESSMENPDVSVRSEADLAKALTEARAKIA